MNKHALIVLLFAAACLTGWCEEKICVSLNVKFAADDKLALVNPDGTGEKDVFTWTGKPVDPEAQIFELRPAPDKRSVIARSSYSYNFTPYEFNAFSLKLDGSQTFMQYTPGPNSGIWDLPGPYGTVTGIVYESSGGPALPGARIYLEGVKNWQTSGADGSFRFENVPSGSRWIVAEDEGYWEGVFFSVTPGTQRQVDLVPTNAFRGSVSSPVRYQDRIYFLQAGLKAGYIDLAGDKATFHEIYVPRIGSCTVPLQWMDVRQSDGKVIITDWGHGCEKSRGLYTVDKDGNGYFLAADFKTAGYTAVDRVFWHPTKPDWVLVAYSYSASSGGISVAFGVLDLNDVSSFKGTIAFPENIYTHGNVELCGWSPKGDAILYSYYTTDPTHGVLAKFAVDANGAFTGGETPIMTGRQFSGAAWIDFSPQAITLDQLKDHILGRTPIPPGDKSAADLNKDNKIDAADMIYLIRQ